MKPTRPIATSPNAIDIGLSLDIGAAASPKNGRAMIRRPAIARNARMREQVWQGAFPGVGL